MQISITNFRGIASADLDLSKICLLAGLNEAGKTSAAQATAAAFTGEPIPIRGIKKTEAGMLVRSGNAKGSATLTGPNGSTEITWPAAKVKTEGQAPFASPFAAGMQTIAPGERNSLDDKERIKILTDYLHATPTRSDLDRQLAGMGLQPTVIEQLWELIEKQGWDNAAAQIKEKGARLKGQWENTTGARYGTKIAESWIPEGYDNELMGQSEDVLQRFVTDARDALEAAISVTAVDDSKLAENEALAALLPGRKIDLLAAENATVDPALAHQLTECQDAIESISKKRDDMNAELKSLPQPTQQSGMECPECKAVLRVEAGKLVHLTGQLSDEEITSRQAAIDDLKTKIAAVNDAINRHMEAAAGIKKRNADAETERLLKIQECKRLVDESEAAVEYCQRPSAAKPEISVDDCRTTLAQAEIRLKAYQSKFGADRLHVAITQNIQLLAHIMPEGIRGDVLAKALKGFNESLAPFCKAAGWKPVILESDFTPTYGGTMYLLLSESAKFRVRVILQIGMALIDKSQAIIIDAADILDKPGRNGLFKALASCGLPALVCMTMDSQEFVPNLGKAGLGRSYWINGEAVAEFI